MATGVGYGKIILFGEHFVVYGIPAIALGLSNKAIVEIARASELTYRSDTPGTIPELTKTAIQNVLRAMKITDTFQVRLRGDLPTSGGLGSSAAFCVALVRALSEEYRLHLANEQVNAYAYEGEKAFHGNPSGVDNTMATYGGAIRFIREKGFGQIPLGTPLYFVVAMTGVSSPTVKMVEKVKKFKEEDPDPFRHLCDQAAEIVQAGEEALAEGHIDRIGRLMNENHRLLRAIGIVIEKNDAIVQTALQHGALGAKVTGGGGGGCCIALATDATHAKKIGDALRAQGFDALETRVG